MFCDRCSLWIVLHEGLIRSPSLTCLIIRAGLLNLTLGAQMDNVRGEVGFLVGNEGAGLSSGLLELATQQVTIPMPGKVESLNAAAATAICLFEAARQRESR